MKRNESFLIAQLLQELNVTIVQDSQEIEASMSEYLNTFFKSVQYISEDIEMFINESIQKNQFDDILIIDFDLHRINSLHIVDKIRHVHPDQIIIAIIAEESVPLLKQCMTYRIHNYIVKPVDKFKLKSLLNQCVEYILMYDKQKLNKEIVFNNEPIEAMTYLLNSFHNSIDLICGYKGLPITKNSSLIDINNDTVIVRVDNVQKFLINENKHVVIFSEYFYEDIYANLEFIDDKQNLIGLNQLKYISSYKEHRSSTRVEPDRSFNFLVSSQSHPALVELDVMNVSSEYCLVKLHHNKEMGYTVNELFSGVLMFEDSKLLHNNIQRLHCECKVVDIFTTSDGNQKALFLLKFNNHDQELINNYIHQRSLQIISELKQKLTHR